MKTEITLIKNKKTTKKNIINLPTPSIISYSWNIGSLLGILISIQITTGLLCSMHYIPETTKSFKIYNLIQKNTIIGSNIKFIHSTTVSAIFIILLIHIYRSIENNSYKNSGIWNSGITLITILIITSFLGYVLPWGQISIWAATVICNIISSIPIIGLKIVTWLWGGFSVRDPTLNRFFSLHFLIPIVIAIISIIHLIILHNKRSSNNLNINPIKDKIDFNKQFTQKDLISLVITIILITIISRAYPTSIIDPENFNPANPIVTPIHIIPEWYFLFAYSILRSIPNKIGGITIIAIRILILPLINLNKIVNNRKFNIRKKIINISKAITIILLSFTGIKTIESPFKQIATTITILYFLIILK